MTEESKIFIVIPAFNEESKIGAVINELKTAGYYNILVINDGSTDKTRETALEAGTEVLDHMVNRGQGAALRTGIEYLKENYNPEIIITFDADGQHQATDLANLIQPILEDEADIALGSRFISNTSSVPFIRKSILKMGILFTVFISSIKLTDTHNGLRALGKKAIEEIKISNRNMEHASDIINEIAKKNLRFKEIPVNILYSNYSLHKGQSSFNFIKMGIKILIRQITK